MAGPRQTDFTPRSIAAPEKRGGASSCMKPGPDGTLSLRDQAKQISLSTNDPAAAWQMLMSWASHQPDRNAAMHPVLFQMPRHADKPGFAAIAPQLVREASRCSMHAEARDNLARMLGDACAAHGLVFNPVSFTLTGPAMQAPDQHAASKPHQLSQAANQPVQPVPVQSQASQDSGFFTLILDALSKMKEQVRDLTTLERATLMEGNDLRRDVATEQVQAVLPNAIIANTPNYAQEPLMQLPLSLQEENPLLPSVQVVKRSLAAHPRPADGGPIHPPVHPGSADGMQGHPELPVRRQVVINHVQPRRLPVLRIKTIHQASAPSNPVEIKITLPAAKIPATRDQIPKVPKLPGVPKATTPPHARKPAKEPALPVAKTRQLPAKTSSIHPKLHKGPAKRAHPTLAIAKSLRYARMRLQPEKAKEKPALPAEARKKEAPKRPPYQAKVQNRKQEAPKRSAPVAKQDSVSRKKARKRVVLLLLGGGWRNGKRKHSRRRRK